MHLDIGYHGGHDDEDFFEVEDDATPEQIEIQAGEIAHDWANNYIELGYDYEPVEPESK